MDEFYIPNYIVKNAQIVFTDEEKTKCMINCTCGNQVLDYISLYFSRSYPFVEKMMELDIIADDMIERRIGVFKNYTFENRIKFMCVWTSRTIDKVDLEVLCVNNLNKNKYSSIDELMRDEHYIAHFKKSDYEDHSPSEYNYITAKCKHCGKEILLFDSRYYGYDGVCTHAESPNKQYGSDGKTKVKKPHCEGAGYKVYVTFSNTGKEDLLENESDGVVTEENWKDAFDWITIHLECSKCGKKVKVFDLETM